MIRSASAATRLSSVRATPSRHAGAKKPGAAGGALSSRQPVASEWAEGHVDIRMQSAVVDAICDPDDLDGPDLWAGSSELTSASRKHSRRACGRSSARGGGKAGRPTSPSLSVSSTSAALSVTTADKKRKPVVAVQLGLRGY